MLREAVTAALEGLSKVKLARWIVHGHTLRRSLNGCQPVVTDFTAGPILTLEPFIEAVREGVLSAGWQLSGLQKTTSHQFEGRWDGESTRSAYLFFHLDAGPQDVSIDVYLDETSRGLMGNMALVVDLLELQDLGRMQTSLGLLGELSEASLPEGHRTPVSLRLRLREAGDDPAAAEAQVRFKLQFPRATIGTGQSAVAELAQETVQAFKLLLGADSLRGLMSPEGPEGAEG